MSVDKLILGTAGLGGLPYGRYKRALSRDDARAVMDHAIKCGINKFDTAPSYGFAEELVGEVCRKKCPTANIFTKTKGDRDDAVHSLQQLYELSPIFLRHNWQYRDDVPPWADGVTTYSEDLRRAARKQAANTMGRFPLFFRFIQSDWNILSQYDFQYLDGSTHFIARSVFLQGVLAWGALPDQRLAPYVDRASKYASSLGVSLATLALRAALQNNRIGSVLVGPTSIEEVDECVDIAIGEAIDFGKTLCLLDAENPCLTDPRKWAA